MLAEASAWFMSWGGGHGCKSERRQQLRCLIDDPEAAGGGRQIKGAPVWRFAYAWDELLGHISENELEKGECKVQLQVLGGKGDLAALEKFGERYLGIGVDDKTAPSSILLCKRFGSHGKTVVRIFL